jgi:hypothetical protein
MDLNDTSSRHLADTAPRTSVSLGPALDRHHLQHPLMKMGASCDSSSLGRRAKITLELWIKEPTSLGRDAAPLRDRW